MGEEEVKKSKRKRQLWIYSFFKLRKVKNRPFISFSLVFSNHVLKDLNILIFMLKATLFIWVSINYLVYCGCFLISLVYLNLTTISIWLTFSSRRSWFWFWGAKLVLGTLKKYFSKLIEHQTEIVVKFKYTKLIKKHPQYTK